MPSRRPQVEEVSESAFKQYVKQFRDLLLDSEQEPIPYIVRAWLVATLPTLILVFFFPALTPRTALETLDPRQALPSLFSLLFIGFFSPLVETLIMMAVFWVLRHFIRRLDVVVVVGAAVWTAFHLFQPAAFRLAAFWPLLVFSAVYLVWSQRSYAQAYWITALTHQFHNLALVLLLFLL